MKVAVVGAGRIGLPLATVVASRGHDVVACDINRERVAAITAGRSPFPDETGLAEALAEVAGSGRLTASGDTTPAVEDCSVVLFAVAVDLGEDGRADLSPLLAACDDVAAGMRPGTLCIFDTTLPPGTTRNVLVPRMEAGGKTFGTDFQVAFSPERLLMGRVIEDLGKYPKVVGGVDEASGERAAEFFADALGVQVLRLASAEAAELSKIAEGVYRDLNIALANELARAADIMGVDISEVTEAANSQPFCHLHTPGTGVGGHCIPVYPRFLMQTEAPSSLAALGRQVNDDMPRYAVTRLAEVLDGLRGKRVLVLGLTFRPDVVVTSHTNALDLHRELAAAGATVEGHDALLSDAGTRSLGFTPSEGLTSSYDAVIVHAYHAAYEDVRWSDLAPVLLDARNALDREAVEAQGVRYLGIGRPVSPA